jgi:hypothetical protein
VDYELTGAKWGEPALGTQGGLVTYSFVTQLYGNEPIDLSVQPLAPEYQTEIRDAFAQWSETAGITFAEVADSASNQIRLGWEPIDGDFHTVGEAYWTYRGGELQQTWIGFDSGESWAPGTNGPELRNGLDFEAVALHEIGHAIGLGHYDSELAIMNPILTIETLQPSDIAGALALYGAPAASVAVAAAGTAAVPASADSHLTVVLPEGDATLEAVLGTLLAAAARPGFDDAVAVALDLQESALDGLGQTLIARANEGPADDGAAVAAIAAVPALETALAAHWPSQDHWFA